MYKCSCCGEIFDEPDYITIRENLDGEHGWWTHNEDFCPYCGSEDFEDYDIFEEEQECED